MVGVRRFVSGVSSLGLGFGFSLIAEQHYSQIGHAMYAGARAPVTPECGTVAKGRGLSKFPLNMNVWDYNEDYHKR